MRSIFILLALLLAATASAVTEPRGWLYVEDNEVRFEALFPYAVAATLLGSDPIESETLEIADQDSFGLDFVTLLEASILLNVDGRVVSSTQQRSLFFNRSIASIVDVPPREVMAKSEALVAVEIRYDVESLPRVIDLRYDLFNPILSSIPVTVYTARDVTSGFLSASSPVLRWVRKSHDQPRRIAPIQLLRHQRLAALDEISLRSAIGDLLMNIYQSYYAGSEGAVYDALSISVCDDFLTEVYLSIYSGVLSDEEEGVRSRVRNIEILNSSNAATPTGSSRQVTVSWQVQGSIEHWGHLHERLNRYHGTLTLSESNGTVKLCGLRVLAQERVIDELRNREEDK